jgi:hypothetical protein
VSSRLVNIAVGVIMVLGGISQFFPPSMSSIVVGVYVIVFGLGKFSHYSTPRSCGLGQAAHIAFQLSPVWSFSPTFPTTPTAMLPSSFPSWAVVSVSLTRFLALLWMPRALLYGA